MLSCDEAFQIAQREINELCASNGVEGLSGKDIPIIGAHAVFSRAYERVRDNLKPGQEERFDADCVAYAKKLIATAILA